MESPGHVLGVWILPHEYPYLAAAGDVCALNPVVLAHVCASILGIALTVYALSCTVKAAAVQPFYFFPATQDSEP